MSIVIVGGNDCMVCRYKAVCSRYGCSAKVFTQMPNALKKQIGSPDLLVVFTSTVSHKMAQCARAEAERAGAKIVHCHSASISALGRVLDEQCTAC